MFISAIFLCLKLLGQLDIRITRLSEPTYKSIKIVFVSVIILDTIIVIKG